MHLQNRVTPFGEIVAISQRGMFAGNYGIISLSGRRRASQAASSSMEISCFGW